MNIKLRLATLAFAVVAGTVGYASAQDYGYGRDDYRYDRNSRYYDRDDYRYDSFRRGMNIARERGFYDGEETARKDMWRGKRYNPYPRGHTDRGYRHEFGDKHEYREYYSDGYREGYMRAYRSDRYGSDRYGSYRYDRYYR
jgi:hypothetical protein